MNVHEDVFPKTCFCYCFNLKSSQMKSTNWFNFSFGVLS